ncbi:DUF6612 family protein [Paenibacillus flagellatus]|uniref:LppX_LprAFG lipoprotein n=1 Tax=Paenibacillus flagellatus TaxID=2211139 RepID=A0A2V5K870_9BACL|nr:DUF6612 family protein [Paenibacillus flagellatus]PYI55695.1 hypothetical protein DLM86_08180 [Paenibacillus flagellatus]
MTTKTKAWKKTAGTVLCAVCIAVVSACGQKPADPGETKPVASAPNAETSAKSGDQSKAPQTPALKTAADVYAKTVEESAKLESVTVNMNMKQTIEQGADKMDIQSKIDMDVVMKPTMSFKQAISMNMAGQDVKMEMYLTKDGFFMKEPTTGQWMKLPAEQMNQIMSAMSGNQMDPTKQLEKMKPFANDFTMDESGDQYVVKLSASGDKFNEFIRNEIAANMGSDPELGEMLKQSADAMKIKKVEYAFGIDKKTFYPKTMNVSMDLDMDVQGQTVKLVQQIDGTYTGYNNIKEIAVPKEALEAKPVGAAQ